MNGKINSVCEEETGKIKVVVEEVQFKEWQRTISVEVWLAYNEAKRESKMVVSKLKTIKYEEL